MTFINLNQFISYLNWFIKLYQSDNFLQSKALLIIIKI